MSQVHFGPNIVRDGLILILDPANLKSSSPYSNRVDPSVSIVNHDYTEYDNTLVSNSVAENGSGTSNLIISPISFVSGSVTIQWSMRLDFSPDIVSIPTVNNWRCVIQDLGNTRIPFGVVLEETGAINFTMALAKYPTSAKRHVNNQFTPIGPALVIVGVWNNYTFTYDKFTGLGAVYLNGKLITKGPLSDAGGTGGSLPDDGMVDFTGSIQISRSNPNTNPGGAGCLPATLGPWLFYDRALSEEEIQQNFFAYRDRYAS